jgi:L-iditol 2-dehydrogenase
MTTTSTSAAFLTAARTLEIREASLPEPDAGEVLIRVTNVGLCGSDAHWYEEGRIGETGVGDGLILGHEFSGVIESGPRSGERVAVDPAIPCLACPPCRAGRSNLCLNIQFAGHGATDGALRTHMVWPERCLVTLPEGISSEDGALLEPIGIALHAIDLANAERARSVGVFGCGPIGLLLISILNSMGVEKIVATDRLPHRLEAARSLGATRAVLATEDERELEALLEASGEGLDNTFEAAGYDAALHSAMTAARPGTSVTVVGIPTGDRTSFAASLARRKELSLVLCRRMLSHDLTRAADLFETLDLTGIVTHRYPFDQVDAAFSALSDRRGLKVVVMPTL